MPNFSTMLFTSLKMQNSTHNARIELALVDLKEQKKLNMLATVKKFHLVKSTLRRR